MRLGPARPVAEAPRLLPELASARRLFGRTAALDRWISSVARLFARHGADELAAGQRRYLKPRGAETRAIVLAATRGGALRELTRD